MELFPDREAGAGQPIWATVRVVNASPRTRYQLRIEALDPRVRRFGDRETTMKGLETATFVFTSGVPEKRGFTVAEQEVD